MATIKTAVALYDGVTSPLKNIHQALNVVINSFESMQRTSGKAVDVAALQEAREQLARAGTAFDSIEESITNADKHQQKFNKSISSGTSAADGLWSKLKNVAATVGGMAAVKKVLDLSDDVTNTNAKLNLIVDDGGSVEALKSKIMAAAQDSRGLYSDTANAVSRLAQNAGDAFDNNDQIIAFTNLLNKQFKISGTSTTEQSAAMTQLTQAMASGVLRGDELNSIFESAPGIIQNIAEYLGVSVGEIRSMASEGQITADVIKNAMFAAADDINEQFETIPMTWGDIWTNMKNKALSIFDPILAKINQIANSEKIQTVTDGIMNGLAGVAAVASHVLDILIDGAAWVIDNWSWIAPVVGGVAAAYIGLRGAIFAYNTIQAISNTLSAISAARTALKAGATLAEAAATTTATGAQVGLNAALLACPITWIILLVVALIAIFYAAVAAINHFADTSVSATGIIAGLFATLGAFIINTFVVPVQNKFANIANFFGNVFNDPIAAVKVLFYDMCLTVIGYIANLAHGIEDLINKIPGVTVDITSGLDNFYAGIEEAQKKVKDESGWVEYVKKMDYIDYSDAAQAGYSFGEGIEDKVKGLFDFSSNDTMGAGDAYSLESFLDGIYSNTGDTAANTAAAADTLEYTEEDLAYLKDIAEREAINRFTTAEIHVEQTNHNNISKDVDVDGIMDAWANDFAEKLDISGEGVHE